jgi:polyhydroxybutyrate depolymerase
MKWLTSILSIAVIPLGLAQQTLNLNIQHEGITRSYILYVPATYNGNPAPLVFNLHGYSSNASQQLFYGDFRPIADTAGFILAVPNGTIQPGTLSTQFWNVGFFPSTINDVGFIEALIDSIQLTFNINPNKIYSTGMSNGGFMSYQLACESNRFAAIASVTGSMTTQTSNNCIPNPPIPIMQIHGTNDLTVPYNGTANFLPIDSLVNYWKTIHGITSAPTISPIPDIDPNDGATAEHFTWTLNNSLTQIELFKVFQGGHTWPGSSFPAGITCNDFNASIEIWRFFSQHSRQNMSLQNINHQVYLYPNPSDLEIVLAQTPNNLAWKIIDLNGRVFMDGKTQQPNTTINISNLANGIYFLITNYKGSVDSFKISVAHP